MIELFDEQIKENDRHSSKGNQLKWFKDGVWYKADYTGYEGLAEYVTSELLMYSNLNTTEFVRYDLEEIKYREQNFLGARSKDILSDDWQIITLERLFQQQFSQSLHRAIWMIPDVGERLEFLCHQVERMTGLGSFGIYITKLLTIDAFFLNEDRHTHNIAILMNQNGAYKLCPIFDNGAGLLADTKLDYPLDGDVLKQMENIQAKTISLDFDEQLEAAEARYGTQIRFHFTRSDVDKILANATQYDQRIIERVRTIIYQQMRKYDYLFAV